MKLRLASYNVHKCLGMDRRRSPERIVSVLNALDADIVALQEVDHRLPPRPEALPRTLIEGETDFGVLPFAPEGPSLGWHGQTMLVRRGIVVEKVRRLLLPGLEPRGAILAELGPEYGGLRIVGVHLGLIRRYRRMQFAAIRAAISRRGDRPTAILGVFNDWSALGGADALGPSFRLHAPGPSFPSPRPIGALDRVALSTGLHLVTAGVHRLAPAALASDHLPVWVDVRVAPPEALA
jgi:endonuclease/exonuclease/phosphatase family metal-dependent hydrolase